MHKRWTAVLRLGCFVAITAAPGPAMAQTFVNGGFETGTLSGWSIVPTFNGHSPVQEVGLVDIDGPGPLPASLAGKFSVGNISSMQNHQAGIDLVQVLNLAGGIEYHITADWAALRADGPVNAEGGVFAIVVDGQVLSGAEAVGVAGPTGPGLPHYGTLRGSYISTAGGPRNVGVRITRPLTVSAGVAAQLHQWVDNVSIEIPVRGACCLNDGTCIIASAFRCAGEDGAYRGDGTACSGANCPPPGACCTFLECLVLSERQCERVWGEYRGHGSACGGAGCEVQGVLVPLPLHENVSSSDVLARGLWFVAPADLVITGLRVPDPGGHGVQNVEIVRLPYEPPSSSQHALNNFVRLGRFIGEDSARIIPVSIAVSAGEVIGVLGNCGQGPMMYHSSGSAYQSSILGEPVWLRRLSMTGNLITGPAQNIWGGLALETVLARVEVYYTEGGAGCYANCDGSTVEPVLNVDDFTCFVNSYAAGQALPHAQQVEHAANCDGSTVAPALNVDDFTCFINAYAQGCG